MSKHTPGPWVTTTAGPVMADYSQGHAIASLEANTLIAGIFSDVRGGEDVAAANARLIAAAPEMLAALHEARLQLEYLSDKWQETGSGNASLARIRAAIAKAEGRS